MTNALKTRFVFSLLMLVTCSVIGQVVKDDSYFQSPVKHELRLAGTFGELRSNHFHAGLDIKSAKGTAGDPIYAAAAGFVSRIKISRTGYGNAIYIDHPNGHTTVYGHLRSLNKKISDFIKAEQFKIENFELDIELDSSQLKVAQGEQVAIMGNSGKSYGPHLHFEIRHTASEVPLNPMIFGLRPFDNSPPSISRIKLFELNDRMEEQGGKIYSTKFVETGKYRISGDTIKAGAWRVGLGVQTVDPMNGNHNKNGVYKIEMLVNDQVAYKIGFDSLAFDLSRYINAHIDYRHFTKKKVRFNRCYKLPGNELPNILSEETAIVKLYENQPQKIEIIVSDFENNQSTLTFWILRNSKMNEVKPLVYNYLLPFDEANIINQNDIKLYFPEKSFYENTYLYLSNSAEKSDQYYAHIYHVGNPETPLHRYAKIYIKPFEIAENLKSKLVLVDCKENNIQSYGGKWEDEFFTASVGSFGSFSLLVDTIGPSIVPLSKSRDLSRSNSISFKISDNMKTAGNAKGLSYRATIDGKWVLFKYDLKTKKIKHNFEDAPDGQTHELLISVADDRGNTSFLKRNFTR